MAPIRPEGPYPPIAHEYCGSAGCPANPPAVKAVKEDMNKERGRLTKELIGMTIIQIIY